MIKIWLPKPVAKSHNINNAIPANATLLILPNKPQQFSRVNEIIEKKQDIDLKWIRKIVKASLVSGDVEFVRIFIWTTQLPWRI